MERQSLNGRVKNFCIKYALYLIVIVLGVLIILLYTALIFFKDNEFLTGLIGLVGGVPAIAVAVATFVSELVKKRLDQQAIMQLEGYKAKLALEKSKFELNGSLEKTKYEHQLAIEKETSSRFNSHQFDIYTDFWSGLVKIKLAADSLFERVTPEKINAMEQVFKEGEEKIWKGAILIDDSHFQTLIEIMKLFSAFRNGKTNLGNQYEARASLKPLLNSDMYDAWDFANDVFTNKETFNNYKNDPQGPDMLFKNKKGDRMFFVEMKRLLDPITKEYKEYEDREMVIDLYLRLNKKLKENYDKLIDALRKTLYESLQKRRQDLVI